MRISEIIRIAESKGYVVEKPETDGLGWDYHIFKENLKDNTLVEVYYSIKDHTYTPFWEGGRRKLSSEFIDLLSLFNHITPEDECKVIMKKGYLFNVKNKIPNTMTEQRLARCKEIAESGNIANIKRMGLKIEKYPYNAILMKGTQEIYINIDFSLGIVQQVNGSLKKESVEKQLPEIAKMFLEGYR